MERDRSERLENDEQLKLRWTLFMGGEKIQCNNCFTNFELILLPNRPACPSCHTDWRQIGTDLAAEDWTDMQLPAGLKNLPVYPQELIRVADANLPYVAKGDENNIIITNGPNDEPFL